jgi:hypothetical protein
MRLTITNEDTFTPEFKGNKNLPSTEQITVRYKTPTVAMKNRCRTKPQTTAISNSQGKIKNMEIIIEKDEIATLHEMLISISNCSYGGGDGKDKVIANAKDLIDAPVVYEPLLKEIVAEFDRILDNVGIDEKN